MSDSSAVLLPFRKTSYNHTNRVERGIETTEINKGKSGCEIDEEFEENSKT